MSPRRLALALVLGGLLSTAPLVASAAPTRPVAAAASEDIRDIRGPIAIPVWWRWLALGGGAALATLAAGVTITLVRRRRRKPLAPHERALARLDAAEPLARAGQAHEYAAAASDAVREYIEECFGVRAAHVTTEEFFDELILQKSAPIDAHREPLLRFLGACDLAKFARFPLLSEGMSSLNELAKKFVLATAPTAPGAATRKS